VSRPLAIAFLACNKNADRFREDASFAYRCDNLAHDLSMLGHQVVCAHVSRCPDQAFDWVVLHRPLFGWRMRWWMRRLRARGARLLADVDDLIFHPELAGLSPGVLNDLVSLRQTRARFAAHRAALMRVDAISVSTQVLADELAALPGAPPVLVLPNTVHHAWRGLPAPPTPACPPAPLIRYLPGTRSHDRDILQASAGLAQVLRAHPQVRLSVTGPLTLPAGLPRGQVDQQPRLPFADYAQVIAGAAVNIAPLEPTRFNRGKSALKVLEAGFWGVPTICSPWPDARRFEHAGAVFAPQTQDWVQLLERLLFNPQAQQAATLGLRERVLALANGPTQAQRWLDWTRALRALP
jgi:glycosyltransferase involved in cell wall biosynthesis